MATLLKGLVRVKTIVTILMSIVFCYMSVVGIISGEQFITIFTTVIAFYFGTQAERRGKTESEE